MTEEQTQALTVAAEAWLVKLQQEVEPLKNAILALGDEIAKVDWEELLAPFIPIAEYNHARQRLKANRALHSTYRIDARHKIHQALKQRFWDNYPDSRYKPN